MVAVHAASLQVRGGRTGGGAGGRRVRLGGSIKRQRLPGRSSSSNHVAGQPALQSLAAFQGLQALTWRISILGRHITR